MYGGACRVTSVGIVSLIHAANGESGCVRASLGICLVESSLLRDQVTVTVRDICLPGHLSCCIKSPPRKAWSVGILEI